MCPFYGVHFKKEVVQCRAIVVLCCPVAILMPREQCDIIYHVEKCNRHLRKDGARCRIMSRDAKVNICYTLSCKKERERASGCLVLFFLLIDRERGKESEYALMMLWDNRSPH